MNLGQRNYGHSSVRLTHFRPDTVDQDELRVLADKVRLVSHVETAPGHERQGHATRMMRKICQQADSEGITLVLEVRQYAGDMDELSLESWYTRLGFMRIQDQPVLMARVARQ